jgi:hypothetical protein
MTDGLLPSTSTLAFQLRLTETQTSEALLDLTNRGLIDHTDNGLMPHNWHARQYQSDSSTERVKRHRARRGNETFPQRSRQQGRSVFGTSPDSEQRTERTEQNEVPVDEFVEFQIFLHWVMCSLDERRGQFPQIVKEALDKRCPGFIDAEMQELRRCANEKSGYTFMGDFVPGLFGWIMSNQFASCSIPPEALKDQRIVAARRYLCKLDREGMQERWFSGSAEYPTFEEWNRAALAA